MGKPSIIGTCEEIEVKGLQGEKYFPRLNFAPWKHD